MGASVESKRAIVPAAAVHHDAGLPEPHLATLLILLCSLLGNACSIPASHIPSAYKPDVPCTTEFVAANGQKKAESLLCWICFKCIT